MLKKIFFKLDPSKELKQVSLSLDQLLTTTSHITVVKDNA